jgi:FKBP-type peptidyl-prolyl cis-trans isomerase (trigger factor)
MENVLAEPTESSIGKEIKIPGFRPGHIPEDVIRENVSKETVKAATLDYVLPQTYAEAVKEHDLQVISQPKVEIKSDVKKEGDDCLLRRSEDRC